MTTPPFPFLSLPLELRETVYSLYFKPADRLQRNHSLEEQGFFGGVYKFDFDLYRVNKQIYNEAKRVWKRENVFVKIATPWPSAGMYRVYLMAEDGVRGGESEDLDRRGMRIECAYYEIEVILSSSVYTTFAFPHLPKNKTKLTTS
tara:strand:+ start:3033 stop:3470 length:438 start_codon:yes stop_codon:yes gene_type:complete